VDLSPAGQQPMWTADRQHAIVFNGEIYNHSELRRSGHHFYRGNSDSETILYQLAQNGISAVNSFNGIFGLGFLDCRREILYLTRDPFGVKPLYYSVGENSFLFSSELRPLQSLLDAPMDTESLAELLCLRYLPAPDTLLKNVHKLRAGHILEVRLSKPKLSVREYPFTGSAPPSEGNRPRFRDAVARYGELFNNAIERQLMADVPIGLLLSGGVDSALIAQAAQQRSSYRMKAFTVGFDTGDDADEIADAEETARVLDLEHHRIRIGLNDFLKTVSDISAIVEEPLATTSIVPMFYLTQLAAQHVKVVLSGQGADEAMGGYRRYQSELLHSWLPGQTGALLQTGMKVLRGRNETLDRVIETLGLSDDLARFEAAYRVFDDDQIRCMTGQSSRRAHERIQYAYDQLRCAVRPRSVERMMSLDLRMSMADDLLLYTDKISMHHSLECRVPLLDLELVRFVESCPAAYRVGLARTKIMHKKYAEGVLPKAIVHRKKKGFQSPTKHWFRSAGRIWDTLLDPNARFACYFDLKEIEKVLIEHRSGLNRERHIFLLLCLHSWMEECLKPQLTSISA
jgi:asparagine synthase (glutamine-hydrolysing)